MSNPTQQNNETKSAQTDAATQFEEESAFGSYAAYDYSNDYVPPVQTRLSSESEPAKPAKGSSRKWWVILAAALLIATAIVVALLA